MINKLVMMLIITGEKQIQSITTIKEMLVMSRFCLPRDIYHGKGCLEELKNLDISHLTPIDALNTLY